MSSQPENNIKPIDPEILDTIYQQVTCDDIEKITETYYKNSENTVDTILELLKIDKKTSNPKKNDPFREMRHILNSKDRVFNARKDK